MCGIAGIVQFHSGGNRDENSRRLDGELRKMTDSLRHRGPDGEGIWLSSGGTTGLGHRRLAIIDLSPAAAQPMTRFDRYAITYNGEIYNYIELQEELLAKGYHFSTKSDTEVLLAAYDCYGADCLSKLDGMFAFAIWDEMNQTLFVARDRFGEKPLYYAMENDSFRFASERKGLWSAGVPRKIHFPMLLNYLVLGRTWSAADRSDNFYEGISSLPPAHYLLLDARDATFRRQCYWDIDRLSQVRGPDNEIIERFRELLLTSVKRRLRMDVAVGSSLSGGVDSSTVTALMAQVTNRRFPVFSAVFPGFTNDESAFVSRMASAYSLESFKTTPEPQDLLSQFDSLCRHQEEPFSSSSIFAQYAVYFLAAGHPVKVLLEGQGADEVLAGYGRHIHWYLQEIARRHPSACARERKQLEINSPAFDWGWNNWLAALFPVQIPGMLEKREARKIRHHPFINAGFRSAYFDRRTLYKPLVLALNDILYFDACQGPLEELLRYADRNSMAHGLELRLPFLSHTLAEFLFSLPARFKIRDGWTKWILRKSMEPSLPAEIVWRKGKVGFEPPQKFWMNTKQLTEKIQEARRLLVQERILHASVLEKKIQPQDVHAADNDDWRWLVSAYFLRKDNIT